MLYQLSIRNVAIIEAVDLTLGEGLNILTGETGAGKSIVIDAVNLVLGGKADRDLIRSGENSARVEAAFFDNDPAIQQAVSECGFDFEDDLLVISRELNQNGRSMCRINGRMATVTQLRDVTRHLINIHGQHESHSLLDPKRHCAMLDNYGAQPIRKALADVAAEHEACLALIDQIESFTAPGFTPEQRMDILTFQLDELNEAEVRDGEEEELEKRRKLLSHAERIRRALETVRIAFEGDDERGGGAMSEISDAAMAVERYSDLDPDFKSLSEILESMSIEIDEASSLVSRLTETFSVDADSLEAVEERLEKLHHLARKYGCQVSELPGRMQEMEEELDSLTHRGERLRELRNGLETHRGLWQKNADTLTALRKRTAVELEKAITTQLSDLGMGRARFMIELIPQENDPEAFITRPNGQEEVRLMISTNRGEAVRPLEKVASGGELSRIMLALKNVFAESDGIHCQIFDEIDAGISGNMARVVAEKLARISRNRQVICITHSPQIAAMADSHYRIEKVSEGERTVTRVECMAENERYAEISRLVGSDMSGDTAEDHARHMVEWCTDFKKEIGG